MWIPSGDEDRFGLRFDEFRVQNQLVDGFRFDAIFTGAMPRH